MRLGVVSDTHNNLKALQTALGVLQGENIRTVLHAGDIENPDHIAAFDGYTLYLVPGNCDSLSGLRRACLERNQPEARSHWELEWDGKKILLFHGDDTALYRRAVESKKYRYIIKGHSHLFEDYVKGESRILNPGALYRSAVYSVGILDVEKDHWRKLEIPKE